MKTLIPLAVCMAAASALFFGFPELRVDRDATACHGGASGSVQVAGQGE